MPSDDDVDFVPILPPPEVPVTSRFKIDTPVLENQFKLTPAPRHAPGHFTNRMIVPRVDGSEKQPQPPALKPPPPVQKEQQHVPPTTTVPSKDSIYTRPAQYPSFIPSPLSAVQTADGTREHASPRKKISFPVAQRQIAANSGIENQLSPEVAPQQPHLPVQQGQVQETAPEPISRPLHIPVSMQYVASKPASELSGSVVPIQGKNRSTVDQTISPVSGRSPPSHDQDLEPKDVGNKLPSIEASVDSAACNAHPMQSRPAQQPAVPPQANSNLQPLREMVNQQALQRKQDYRPQQANRPLREVLRIRKPSRSLSGSSSGSGVSKRATRSIRDLNMYRDRDLPEVANKVNDLWVLCNGAVKEAEKESQHRVEKYRKKLHDRSQRIARYLETIDLQTQAIQNLEGDKHDMQSRVERLENELRTYSDVIPKLQDKCRGMKETLDSALQEQLEQQQLHAAYKKSSQDMINEMRAEKQREHASRELVERQLAAVREQMKEKVRQVELLSQEECRHMSDQLQQLCRELDEKDSQIKREKEISESVAKQLANYQDEQQALEVLRSQTSDILKILSEQHSRDDIKQVKLAQADHGAKLEGITEHLESLKGLVAPHDEVISSLGQKQEEILSRIMSTLEAISEGQSSNRESVDAVGQLSTELRNHIDEMWRQLDSREATLTQQLDEKRAENAEITRMIQEGEHENQSLETQLRAAEDKCKEQEGRLSELGQEVEELKAGSREVAGQQLQIQTLLAEKKQLKDDLKAKASGISNLETQLADTLKSSQLQIQGLTEENQKKASEMEAQQKANSTMIQTLNNTLAESRKQVTDTVAISGSQAEKLRAILQSLGNWAQETATAYGFAEDLDRIWKECEPASDQGVKWTRYLEKILSRIAFKEENIGAAHQAEASRLPLSGFGDTQAQLTSSIAGPLPLNSGSHQQAGIVGRPAIPDSQQSLVVPSSQQSLQPANPQQNLHLRPLNDAAGMFGERRVTVQSPHAGVVTPVPPSVEQEKTQRRGGAQPKPIIKRVTRSSTTSEASQIQGQDIVPASSLLSGYGSFQLHPNSNPRASGHSSTEQRNDGNVGRENANQAPGDPQSTNGRPPTKIKVKNQKRGRKTLDSQAIEQFSPNPPSEVGHDHAEHDEDDDAPLAKRTKVQKPTARGNTKRGKSASTQANKQKAASGSAAGVVHGSLAGVPGVVHGAPNSSQQNSI